MKAIGFNIGQFGDLIMQTVVCKGFKEMYPDSHLILGIGNKYSNIAPLFLNNKFIDEIHIWDSYQDWPNKNDKKYLNNNKFDIIYNGMADHKDNLWFLTKRYTEEFCLMHDIIPPNDLSCYLNPWFNLYNGFEKCITLSLFPSNMTDRVEKTLSLNKLNKLCQGIRKKGYIPIQLGGKYEPKLENAERPIISILEATKILLSSNLHITTDTSFSWISSAYKHSTIGLYSLSLPYQINTVSHRPINENATYISKNAMCEIEVEEILEKF